MIRVVYFHEGNQFGGAERSLLNLASRLDQNTFDPAFICGTDGLFTDHLLSLSINFMVQPFPPIKPHKLFDVAKTYSGLLGLCQRLRPQIIHANSPRTNFYSGLAGHKLNIPVVWHARNLLAPGQRWDPDKFFSFMPKVIICNSKAIAKRFNKKAATIMNGVDLKKFNPKTDKHNFLEKYHIPDDHQVVMMTSRICPGKGHETFLEAAQRVKQAQDKVFFVIVGDVPDENEIGRLARLKELCEELDLSSHVVFTGFIEDIPQALAACDLFILAAEAEPCGRVLFEAMAMGKPVIATNTGGTPEIVEDHQTGRLLPPGNPELLADAILNLLNQPEEAKAMGEKGRQRVTDHFSIEKHVRETEKIYKAIVEGTLCV